MIFVDTSFFFALASSNDPDHARVVEVFRGFDRGGLADRLLTSNHVVGECITLTRREVGHRAAVKMGEFLFSQKIARIHWVSPEEEAAAFDYLRRYDDKLYSMVDCLCFVLMEQLGITEALSLDSDFTHRFTAIPGPRR